MEQVRTPPPMPPPQASGAVNRLLEALCIERPELRASTVAVDRPVGHEFCAQGESISDVYFPVSGVLSLSLTLRSGQGVDCSTVGCEGLVGLPVYMGLKTSPYRVAQLMPGRVLRVPAKDFCSHIEGSRSAVRVLKRFTAFSLQLGEQNAVCNLYHSAQQRACRWLLDAADRTQGTPMRLTQALWAETLGVRRQTVAQLALSLQRAGLLAYRQTIVTLIDRAGIEALACECYDAMRTCYEETIGSVVREGPI